MRSVKKRLRLPPCGPNARAEPSLSEIAAMGPECIKSGLFCQESRQWGLKVAVSMPHEGQNGPKSAIRARFQGLIAVCKLAERPHCATFCHKRLPALQQAFLERGNYPKAHVCSADPQHQLHSSTGPRSMTLQSNSLTDPQPRLHSSADPRPREPTASRPHRSTSPRSHGLTDPWPHRPTAPSLAPPISLSISPSPTLENAE